MLKKRHRLTKNAFDRYFKTGQRVHTPLVQLIYTPDEVFHGAVVVGKKVSRQAVRRNQLRRRVYSQVYRWWQDTNQTGVYIVVLKPDANTASKTELHEAVISVLNKSQAA